MTSPAVRADVLAAVEAALSAQYGQHPARASVSFVGVDPIEVLRFRDGPADEVLVTLGMSGNVMTAAQESVLDGSGPRAELLLSVHSGWGEAWRSLAVLAAAPAVEGLVYAPGATIDTATSLAPASRCTGGLIAEPAGPAVPTGAGEVQLLPLHPATATELAWCRVHGADALRGRWAEQGVDLRDLGRSAVRLD
jgi:hypothetical protein